MSTEKWFLTMVCIRTKFQIKSINSGLSDLRNVIENPENAELRSYIDFNGKFINNDFPAFYDLFMRRK